MGTEVSLEFEFRNKRHRDAQKGVEALVRELGRATSRLGPVLKHELLRYMQEVRKSLIQRHSQAFINPTNVPATGASNLLRRQGGVAGIKASAVGERDLNQITGVLTIPFPISVHEEGATIRPRAAQYLTIPLSAALDSRGVPLRPSARSWDNTFVQTSTRGNLLIFQRRGSKIVPLYLLRRQVKLPARLRAQATLEAGQDHFVDRSIEAMTKELLKRV